MQSNCTRSRFIPLIALVLGGLAFAGCDDGLVKTEVGSLEVSPTNFQFGKIELGSTRDDTVRLTNVGAGTLKMTGFRITGQASGDFNLYWYLGDDDSAAQNVGIEDGQVFFPRVVDLEPEGIMTLILAYTPTSDLAAAGSVVFETNDSDEANRNVEIPIVASEAGAELRVSPTTVDFGRVPAGNNKRMEVTVTNTGQATANIESMTVHGSEDFNAWMGEVDVEVDPTVLADPDGDGTPGLSPAKQFTFEVTFAPEVDGPDQGEISIISNSAVRDTRVGLIANGASPCINVVPESLDFGAALVGRNNPRGLSIESCGGEPLQLKSIRLADGSDAFALDVETVPDLPANLPAYDRDQAPPARTINVLFHPEQEIPYSGTVIIESNDPDFPVVEVPLLGRGSVNECPTAAVVQTEFDVLPLDIITLDGSDSVDPDGPMGRPVTYEWTVIRRPDGSTAEPVEQFFNPARPADGGPADRMDTPTAFFFVDLAGDYTIELRVVDNMDTAAPSDTCPQPAATVTIHAQPDEDIHVQLVWHTAGDDDETDSEGSDIDLHMLHPHGRAWAVAPLDCYFANSEPDWGPLGPPGNPSLDIDDVNGAGPENINLDEPEDTGALGGTYRVGVHYYRAENFVSGGTWGPSEVTIRIFLGGEEAGEWTREITRTDHFWEVASIIWTEADKRVQVINRYHNSVP
jgi:hypothetical protein